MSSKTTINDQSQKHWAAILKQNTPPRNRKERRTFAKCLRVLKKYQTQEDKEE